MPLFTYKALDQKGTITTGLSDAPDLAHLTDTLQKKGLFLIEGKAPQEVVDKTSVAEAPRPPVEAAKATKATVPLVIVTPVKERLARPTDKATPKQVALFTTELGIMIRTSLPIMDAFEGLARQQPEPIFQSVLRDISKSVREGHSLSDSFSRFPKVFDDIYISLLRAGESSGHLSKMLDCIVEYLNFRIELQVKIRSALLYPAIVVITSLLVVSFLVFFILPTFMDVFSQLGVALPMPTRVLLGLSDHLRHFCLVYMAASYIVYWFFRRWVADSRNLKAFDTFKLNLPIAGPVIRSISIVRMLRTLASLLSAGVPILRSLELTRDLAGNAVYRDLFAQVHKEVSEGHGLSTALGSNPYFPRTVVDMIANAEKTGTLPEVLNQVSAYYEKETDTSLKNLFSALEPLFVVFLGVMVGGIAIAILLPIFEIGNAIQ